MRGVDRAIGGGLEEFHLLKALRPFSFAVALVSCTLGITLAYLDGYTDPLKIVLILLAGLLAQSGVNLVNDMGDWGDLKRYQSAEVLGRVRRNFIIGLLAFVLAALIALYLLQEAHWSLFVICVIGLLGALGYALPPIDLKSRGLAVVLVFWLMGVLMVFGAYLALGGGWSWTVFWNSIPISLLVSELLLANEIRDQEADAERGLRTLSVRIGLANARVLYRVILLLAILLPVVLYLFGIFGNPLWLFPVVLLMRQPLRLLSQPRGERQLLPPLTARLLLLFGGLYVISLSFMSSI